MRRTLDAIANLVEKSRFHRVSELVAVGTAALRDAENRDDFLRRIEERCGLKVEVISGEEEARLSYLAVRKDPKWRNTENLWVIDIGGGSTEIIQGKPNSTEVLARVSVNLGAVKITERFLRSDPPRVTQLIEASNAIAKQIAEQSPKVSENETLTLVGVGGTVTNLGAVAYAGKNIENLHGQELTLEAIEDQIERFAMQTIEDRKKTPGLNPQRADIILGGALLLAQSLFYLGCSSLTISTGSLRWGVLYDRFLD